MDKSLDEIISNKRPQRHPRRSAGAAARGAVLGRAAPTPAQKARAAPAVVAPKAPAGPAVSSEKIMVSGLPLDVNEAQVKDLFHQTIGPVREVTLSYNAQGKSKGTATVLFSRKGDANKAYQQYNNRLIDGNQPMKIDLIVDPVRAVPLASRVAPAPVVKAAAPPRSGPVRRRRGGAPRRGPKPAPKTAADLDAEMEDYTASASAPAAAAAAT
ncbi:hypothetical protein EST38_g8975 [Candolleomyces aberdarensis]|uniref:RRM domain-containing protein n=1 Tax=Candolleomyces aberdarensis TaxID=2316362 RepID=A0A4Q2DBX5_9AGAR|nr:hypothetical protein EST38_g8975 [Candolleomyces aberdarensis]